MKFPRDAPRRKVIKTLESLGFRIVRMGEHISMVRENPDGTKTPLTLPNHERIKGSTLRVICRQAGIKREDIFSSRTTSSLVIRSISITFSNLASLPSKKIPDKRMLVSRNTFISHSLIFLSSSTIESSDMPSLFCQPS